MTEYIERSKVLAEYDRQHEGAPGRARKIIEAFPAADVAEVRHGRWVWDDNGMDWGLGAWKCSVCHSKPETWWEADKRNPYRCSGSHYCPNCGAKMDYREGDEDD